jgi:hypothetical protein
MLYVDDFFYYENSRFSVNFKVDSPGYYWLEKPKLTKLDDSPRLLEVEDSIFVKKLDSTYECDVYKRLGEGLAPKILGTFSLGCDAFIALERMEPLTFDWVHDDLDRAITQLIALIPKLHKQNIIHRDIRTANLLVKDDQMYICDFEQGYSEAWSPPEVIGAYEFTTRSDAYSVGCTIVEMITMKDPWDGVEGYTAHIMNRDYAPLLAPVKDTKYYALIEQCIVHRTIPEHVQL